jgi:hypothetical protein
MPITVWNGSTNITESCTFIWNATGGTLQNTENNTNYFSTMTEDTATAQVVILYSTELIGVREFSISKTKQGEGAIFCYVHSSMGNLFETEQEGNTVLTAYIY